MREVARYNDAIRRRSTDDLVPLIRVWEHGLYRTLQRHGIIYNHRTLDKARGPQVFTFRLKLADPADLKKTLPLEEQLAMMMSVGAVRVARNLGEVDVEVALPRTFHRSLSVSTLEQRGGAWITLGQTPAGRPVYVNLDGTRSAHILVSGQTGSGKTVCEQLIAWTIAQQNRPDEASLLLIDGKGGTRWWGFERAAALAHPVIGDPGEAIAALTWAVVEMDRRKANGQDRPRLVIVLDEVREIIEVGGPPIAEAIGRIASLGRELGVHIIVATQHALTGAIGGAIAKANLTLRLTGLVTNSNNAYLATGVKDSGAERLMGNGDFLLSFGDEVYRLQVAMPRPRDIGKLVQSPEPPRIDFGTHDTGRVLDVTPKSKATPLDPSEVAFALARGCGIPTIREQFKPMGAKRAGRIRDFARAMKDHLADLGYTYPLPLTRISAETRAAMA